MRIGVIGIGSWGLRVAKEYLDLVRDGYIDDLILCDIDKSKLEIFSDEAITTDSLDHLINRVDGIHICTPNSTHYEITKKALENGVHVLVEKPMATDHGKAYEIAELALSNDLILQVGHIYRFANVIRKTKELYEKNYFGEIYYFNLTWTHLIPYIDGVDILWDLLPHPLDILNFITKEWPLEFSGVGRAFRRATLNEVVSLQALFNHFFASIHLSWLSPIRRRVLEIVGSKRTALVECVKQTIKLYEEGEERMMDVKANNTIKDEIINFIEAIKTGKNTFNSSIIGVKNVEMIEKALNSLR